MRNGDPYMNHMEVRMIPPYSTDVESYYTYDNALYTRSFPVVLMIVFIAQQTEVGMVYLLDTVQNVPKLCTRVHAVVDLFLQV